MIKTTQDDHRPLYQMLSVRFPNQLRSELWDNVTLLGTIMPSPPKPLILKLCLRERGLLAPVVTEPGSGLQPPSSLQQEPLSPLPLCASLLLEAPHTPTSRPRRHYCSHTSALATPPRGSC